MGPNPISWQTYICTMSMSMTCWRNFYNGSVAMCNRHILFHNFTEEELVESLVLFYLPKLNPCHSTYTYSCLWLAGMDVWLWLCDLLTLDLDLEGCRWKRQTLPLSSQNHFVQEVTLSGFFFIAGTVPSSSSLCSHLFPDSNPIAWNLPVSTCIVTERVYSLNTDPYMKFAF